MTIILAVDFQTNRIKSVNLYTFRMENGKRKRNAFTVKEKIEALDRIKSGVKQSHVAKDLGLDESTVQGWKKEAKLREGSGFVRK